MATLVTLLRRWWQIPTVILLSLLIQKAAFESRYDVSGHALGHLGSSTAIFLGVPVVLILLWSLPAPKLRPLVLIGCVVWLVGLVGVLVGNVRVVDAIGSADWNDAQASALGPSRPGFESGHDLAEIASFVAVVGALFTIVALWRAGLVSTGVAIVSAVLSVLIPPWIFPGAGVVVVTAAVVLHRERERRSESRSAIA